MQCSCPPPLTEDQLSAALDDHAEPAVQEHLARCASCAARLSQARQVERSLRAGLRRWDCPTPERLGDYHLRLVGESDMPAIGRHVEQCVMCRAELDELRSFLDADAVRQPRPRERPAGPTRPWLSELIARMLPPAPALAARGGRTATITAAADGVTIILDPQPAPEGKIDLSGQIVADDQEQWNGALVELRQSGVLLTTAAVDDVGGFHCPAIPPGPVGLRITPEHGRPVVVQEVTLAAP